MRVVVLELPDPGLLPPAPLLHRAQGQLQRVQARLGKLGGGGGHVSGVSWRFEAQDELLFTFPFSNYHIHMHSISLFTLLSVYVRDESSLQS